MGQQTRILLFGSLRPDIAKESIVEYTQHAPLPLTDLLRCLPISADRVQLVMVNHKAVSFDYAVCPGDRVALFPREYMIFSDWKDFRIGDIGR